MSRWVPQVYCYPTLTCRAKNIRGKYYVHDLVASAFLGERPAGHVVSHKNHDGTDNRAANLEWATQGANLERSCRDDRLGYKLTNEDVGEIRRRLAEGEAGADLSREYGVSRSTVSLIKRRKWWRHVP